MIAKQFSGATRNAYLELVKQFPLVSIRTRRQFASAQKFIDGLLTKGKLTAGEQVYLDALSDLVAAFEDEYSSLPPASDADMLRHLLDAKQVSQANLCRATRVSPSIVSEVLSGKRPFSKAMVGKFSKFFGVSKSVLLANV